MRIHLHTHRNTYGHTRVHSCIHTRYVLPSTDVHRRTLSPAGTRTHGRRDNTHTEAGEFIRRHEAPAHA